MPNMSTHIHFALLFAERAQYDIHLASLIKGAVTPCFHSGEDAFKEVHFLGTDTDISTNTMDKNVTDSLSFHQGYLSHFFLDHYFEAYRGEIFLFQSPLKKERMRIMSMAEQIDIMYMKEYEVDLQSLSEKYRKAFTNLYHAVSASGDECREIERDYETLMIMIVEKFTQFLKALKFPSASDDLIP